MCTVRSLLYEQKNVSVFMLVSVVAKENHSWDISVLILESSDAKECDSIFLVTLCVPCNILFWGFDVASE